MKKKSLIIIGGGPAGLFAALNAADTDLRTTVLEGEKKAGKKLLLTGGGQCNVTNMQPTEDMIHRFGDRSGFVKHLLSGYTNRDVVSFFEKQSVALYTRADGKVFPKSEKSSDILDALLRSCGKNGAVIKTGTRVHRVRTESEGFAADTDSGTFRSDYLLIATGGYTFPSTGSRGDGYTFARTLGHAVITPSPALASVTLRENVFRECSGISTAVSVSHYRQNKKQHDFSGDLLFTHSGLSGPVILDNSRYIADSDLLEINFMPEYPARGMDTIITGEAASRGKEAIKTIIRSVCPLLPLKLILTLLKESGLEPDRKAAEISRSARQKLVQAVTSFHCSITRKDSKKAMCTAGGVDTGSINRKTMESRIVPGLFFAGEVIDVDGDSGGFNLQFAFSSAKAAADTIRGKLQQDRSTF